MRCASLTICIVLSACTQFPELDRAISDEARDAPFPELEDADILAAQAAGGSNAVEVEADLTGRAEALRARGSAFQEGGVDDATRSRMLDGRARIEAERARLSGN